MGLRRFPQLQRTPLKLRHVSGSVDLRERRLHAIVDADGSARTEPNAARLQELAVRHHSDRCRHEVAGQLRAGVASVSEVAAAADYGSVAAFSRAFSRAYGTAPSAFAESDLAVAIEAPNGIHFHAPAGLLIPARARNVPDTFLA